MLESLTTASLYRQSSKVLSHSAGASGHGGYMALLGLTSVFKYAQKSGKCNLNYPLTLIVVISIYNSKTIYFMDGDVKFKFEKKSCK